MRGVFHLDRQQLDQLVEENFQQKDVEMQTEEKCKNTNTLMVKDTRIKPDMPSKQSNWDPTWNQQANETQDDPTQPLRTAQTEQQLPQEQRPSAKHHIEDSRDADNQGQQQTDTSEGNTGGDRNYPDFEAMTEETMQMIVDDLVTEGIILQKPVTEDRADKLMVQYQNLDKEKQQVAETNSE